MLQGLTQSSHGVRAPGLLAAIIIIITVVVIITDKDAEASKTFSKDRQRVSGQA